ncbi:MAG TPA: tetratricopeptide repeat protein [Flavilitoribacter sp.]|nr:tetratricopeptide repeat protein [Flavilitoribacter sp.]
MTNYYEWITDYLSGELEEKDKLAFEAALRQDQQLAVQVETYRKTLADLSVLVEQESAETELKATLEKTGRDFFLKEETPVVRMPFYRTRFFQLAAAAAVLLLIAFAVFGPKKNNLPAPVYANYAHHYPASFTVMGANEELLTKAEQAFNQQDYATAGDNLQAYLQDNPDHSEAALYLGICRMEQGRSSEANALFKQLLNHPSYQNEARWNLAMLALKNNNKEECAEWLSNIPEGADRYAEAQKLLKALGQPN